ncbi:alpha/beta fold hydrolase [Streptomyces narbonensis]|uniref:alpha/beta fold hydrolase n=1 Tax=Streptomyces narbonensis TaxID=67333 RepID=UPI00167874DD|nr:alpha/beta hydrolase [Streptomyces narbonensis]GGV97506.1 alpha/beta hydrolase [Streptomyces narbonensis]
MARRLDVTGAGGVRLAAWDYTKLTGEGEGPKATPRPPAPRPADGLPVPAATRAAAAATPTTTPSTPSAQGVLLLHGLMGHAAHWAPAVSRLTGRHRVIALDQRGHGHSQKPSAGPFTREAYVADAAAVIEQLGLGPVTLVGHSMGALTAWQLAAERPDLVRALVICDMRASALGAASQRAWQDWFRGWPAPFPSLDAVRRWFGDDDPWVERPNPARGAFFAEVMAEHPDGWRPVFDPAQMLTSRETWVHDAHWDSLAQVRCPTLVVRGLDGELGRAEAQEMVRVLPHGAYAEIPDAGHLLHYEHPEAWGEAVEPFLNGVLTP